MLRHLMASPTQLIQFFNLVPVVDQIAGQPLFFYFKFHFLRLNELEAVSIPFFLFQLRIRVLSGNLKTYQLRVFTLLKMDALQSLQLIYVWRAPFLESFLSSLMLLLIHFGQLKALFLILEKLFLLLEFFLWYLYSVDFRKDKHRITIHKV